MEYTQRASSLISRGKDYFVRANMSNNGNYYNRGANYFLESIDESTAAIQLMPDKIDSYEMRAYAYFQIGDYQSALKDFDKCIQFNPQDSNYYDFRGTCHFNLGDFSHAIEDYTKVIQFTTNKEFKSFLHTKIGQAHLKLFDKYNYDADYKSAHSELIAVIKEYEKAIEIDSKNFDACEFLGRFFSGFVGYNFPQRFKLYDKAVEYYIKAIEIDPNRGANLYSDVEYCSFQAAGEFAMAADHEKDPKKAKEYRKKSEEFSAKEKEYKEKAKKHMKN